MTLFTPFHKWVTEEHKLFTESVQKFYNDEMKPNIEDWVDNGVVSKSFWEKAGHAGIMSGSVLEEHGGVGGDMGFDSITVYEQAKTGDSSWGYGIQSIVIHYLNVFFNTITISSRQIGHEFPICFSVSAQSAQTH